MTQFQYDAIIAVIKNGAPALANELIGSIDNVIRANAQLAKENKKLNEKIKPEEKESK